MNKLRIFGLLFLTTLTCYGKVDKNSQKRDSHQLTDAQRGFKNHLDELAILFALRYGNRNRACRILAEANFTPKKEAEMRRLIGPEAVSANGWRRLWGR